MVQREHLPGLESYGDRPGIFTVTSQPQGGPAPDNIKDQWVEIAFEIGVKDIVVIEPGTFPDGREDPYTAVRVASGVAIEKLIEAGRDEAVRFWEDQAKLRGWHYTDPIFFNGECGRLIVQEDNTEALLGTDRRGWPRFDKVPLQDS